MIDHLSAKLISFVYKKSKSLDLIEQIKFQLSILIYTIQSASSILKEPIDFNRYV